MCRSMGGSMGRGWGEMWEAVSTICFGLHNICNGRNGGLESALHTISQVNMDLGVFQEKNFTEGIFMRESGGYWVTETAAPNLYHGGVAVFYRKEEHFTLEVILLHGQNVIRSQMATGGKWWHVVGCYIPLDYTSTI